MHDRKLIELMGAEEARKKGLNFDLIEGPKDPEVAGLLGLGGPDLPRAPRLSTTALPFAGAGQMLLNLGQGQGQGQGAESGGSGEASAAQKRLGGPISGREEGGESGEAVRQPPKKRRLTAVPSLGGALAATAAVLGMEGAGAGAVLVRRRRGRFFCGGAQNARIYFPFGGRAYVVRVTDFEIPFLPPLPSCSRCSLPPRPSPSPPAPPCPPPTCAALWRG